MVVRYHWYQVWYLSREVYTAVPRYVRLLNLLSTLVDELTNRTRLDSKIVLPRYLNLGIYMYYHVSTFLAVNLVPRYYRAV